MGVERCIFWLPHAHLALFGTGLGGGRLAPGHPVSLRSVPRAEGRGLRRAVHGDQGVRRREWRQMAQPRSERQLQRFAMPSA